MERFSGTLTTLLDYVSAMTPYGVMGDIVLVFGLLILAIGIDRVRAKIDALTNDVKDLSRKIDALTLAIKGHGGGIDLDVEISAAVEAPNSAASLVEIRERLEALSAGPARKIGAGL